jgi:hypothetical protein
MDVVETAEHIQEVAEERRRESDDRFKQRAAIGIGVLAMLLAITGVGGENAMKEMFNANIQASDTWAFYQAKNIRQTDFRLAANELELSMASLPPEQQARANQRIGEYQATIARYESEPDPTDPTNLLKGEGKKELSARAQDYEAKRDHAQRQDPNFDYARALFEIAIVLGSVSIVATSRPLLGIGLALGAVATVLMLNGFLLFLNVPFLGGEAPH